MNKAMYSTSEIAKILRVSRITVFNKIKNKQIKADKVGRNYIVAHEELMKALGKIVGSAKKKRIEGAVKKAVREYGKTFERLARE